MPGFGTFGSLSPRMGMRGGFGGGFGGGQGGGQGGGWGQRFKNAWGAPQPDANNPMQGATPNLQPATEPAAWGSQFNGFGGSPGWGNTAPPTAPVADPAAAQNPWAAPQQGFGGGIDPHLQRLMQMLKQGGGGFGGGY